MSSSVPKGQKVSVFHNKRRLFWKWENHRRNSNFNQLLLHEWNFLSIMDVKDVLCSSCPRILAPSNKSQMKENCGYYSFVGADKKPKRKQTRNPMDVDNRTSLNQIQGFWKHLREWYFKNHQSSLFWSGKCNLPRIACGDDIDNIFIFLTIYLSQSMLSWRQWYLCQKNWWL